MADSRSSARLQYEQSEIVRLHWSGQRTRWNIAAKSYSWLKNKENRITYIRILFCWKTGSLSSLVLLSVVCSINKLRTVLRWYTTCMGIGNDLTKSYRSLPPILKSWGNQSSDQWDDRYVCRIQSHVPADRASKKNILRIVWFALTALLVRWRMMQWELHFVCRKSCTLCKHSFTMIWRLH